MIKLEYKNFAVPIERVDLDAKAMFGADFDGVVFGTRGIYLIFFQNEALHEQTALQYWQNFTEETLNGSGTTGN